MQYTRGRPGQDQPKHDPRVYADMEHLVRLQFEAQGFSFLPHQPLHSVLYGRHASRLRGAASTSRITGVYSRRRHT
jgi:hypothetical protein